MSRRSSEDGSAKIREWPVPLVPVRIGVAREASAGAPSTGWTSTPRAGSALPESVVAALAESRSACEPRAGDACSKPLPAEAGADRNAVPLRPPRAALVASDLRSSDMSLTGHVEDDRCRNAASLILASASRALSRSAMPALAIDRSVICSDDGSCADLNRNALTSSSVAAMPLPDCAESPDRARRNPSLPTPDSCRYACSWARRSSGSSRLAAAEEPADSMGLPSSGGSSARMTERSAASDKRMPGTNGFDKAAAPPATEDAAPAPGAEAASTAAPSSPSSSSSSSLSSPSLPRLPRPLELKRSSRSSAPKKPSPACLSLTLRPLRVCPTRGSEDGPSKSSSSAAGPVNALFTSAGDDLACSARCTREATSHVMLNPATPGG